MRIPDETRDQLSAKFAVLFPHLDERQRRLLMGTEARLLGHGGIRAVARAARVSETTVAMACSSWNPERSRSGGSGVPPEDANGSPIWIRGCGRHYWRW